MAPFWEKKKWVCGIWLNVISRNNFSSFTSSGATTSLSRVRSPVCQTGWNMNFDLGLGVLLFSDLPGAKVPSDTGSVPVHLDWVSSSRCGSGVNPIQDSWDLEICPLELGMSPFQRDASSESCIPEKAVCIYGYTLLLWGCLTFLQSWIFLFFRCVGSPSSQGKVLLTL